MFSPVAKPRSTSRAIVAGFAAFAILLLSALSAAPHVHAALHAHEQDGAQHSHTCNHNDCPIAIFANGVTPLHPFYAEPPVISRLQSIDVRISAHVPHNDKYLIPQGRAPPLAA